MPIVVFKVLFLVLAVIVPLVVVEVLAFTGRILASSAQALYVGMFAAFSIASVFSDRWGWALVTFLMTCYKARIWYNIHQSEIVRESNDRRESN